MSVRVLAAGAVFALVALAQDSDIVLAFGIAWLLGAAFLEGQWRLEEPKSPRAARPKTMLKVSFQDERPADPEYVSTFQDYGTALPSAATKGNSTPLVASTAKALPAPNEFEARRDALRKLRVAPGVYKTSEFDMRRQRLAEHSLGDLRRKIEQEFANDPSVLAFLTDNACYRFLRAREGNPQAAMQMIRATVQWRHKNHMFARKPRCDVCEEQDPKAHAYFCIGLDTHDRAVMYSCSARATDQKSIEGGIHHMVCEMEHFLNDEAGIAQVVWVVDFNGFKARHANPDLGRHAASLFQQVYPERLGQLVLLDFPWLFSVFFRIVSPLIDPVTRGKILILRSDEERNKYFEENWNPTMVQWMKDISNLAPLPGLYPASDIIKPRYWK